MSSSVFGTDVSTYAPGASVVDPNNFLAGFTGKKIKKKDIQAFQDAGGNMDKLRKQFEKGKFDDYNFGDKAEAYLQNQTSKLKNIEGYEKGGEIDTQGFLDEFASGKGKISKTDAKTFEAAGGDLGVLKDALAEGDMYQRSDKEEVFADNGGVVPFGNEDYYAGNVAAKFLDKKVKDLNEETEAGIDPTTGVDTDLGVGTDPGTVVDTGSGGDTGLTTDPTVPDPSVTDPSVTDPVITDPVVTPTPTPTPTTDPSPTPTPTPTPTPGDGDTETSPIPVLPTDNEYPTNDVGSGFPFNPGRHQGAAFTPYKENISDVLVHTDQRLDRIRSERISPEDTVTQSYTQQLIDGGILPGTEGYVSASDKYDKKIEETLPVRDAHSDEEMAKRHAQYGSMFDMLRTNASARREAKDEDLRDRMSAMLELQAANRRNDRPNTILAYMGTPMESGGPAPIDLTTPAPSEPGPSPSPSPGGGGDDGGNEQFSLPDLPDKVKEQKVSIPDFNKNPSFDGNSFADFLMKAKQMLPGGRPGLYGPGEGPQTNIPIHKSKNKLYNKLLDAGMSEDDMFKAAQYAGLTNIRTGKEGKSDFKQMMDAYNNNFYQDMPAPKQKGLKKFNKAMDEIEQMFGGKFKFKTYKQALKGNKASTVNDWVKQYIDLGGGVGRKVTDAIGL